MRGEPVDVYLEVGTKRVFAGAVDWPGWCRSGRDEDAALATLLAYARRYREVVRGFPQPSGLNVVERLRGNATTDFGAPDVPPRGDARSLAGDELERHLAVVRACWAAFDDAADSAEGRTLIRGPRGGGRDVRGMREHVLESDAGYLRVLGGRYDGTDAVGIRAAMVQTLVARARGHLPDRGPRGGRRWTARYAIRRSAWHALDHAWEIEDRSR